MKFVDNLIASLRYRKILQFLKEKNISLERKRIVDLGGGGGELKKILEKKGAKVITVDKENADIIWDLNKPLPFKDKEFDISISLATVEHLENPYLFLNEMKRIADISVGTTPHKKSKPLLELLAFMNIVNKDHIKDHKIYMSEDSLKNFSFNVELFELGMNILFYYIVHPKYRLLDKAE